MASLTTAQYAAIVSTFLLLIKIYELIMARFRLDAYMNMDGPNDEKEIVITNLTSRAIHIKSIDLYWSRSRYISDKCAVNLDHGILSRIKIGAYDFRNIEFTEQHNFRFIKDKKLYMKMRIAGRWFHPVLKIHG